ncbi:MAG: D-alanine--D-alanine ligase [Myxococcota bacterium]|nr:D-alanine--D-alanine ligase [Myxococcota bacterium]
MTGRFRNVRVGVVCGGLSEERAVSLATGRAAADALRRRGYDVVEIDGDRSLDIELRREEVGAVFNALHGTYGEDGRLQGMLDWMAIPYTGEGQRSSLLGFDKGLAKMLYRQADVPVARDYLVSLEQARRLTKDDVAFGFPLVVKPVAQGSSVGVFLVQTDDQFQAALDGIDASTVLIEEFVEGPEASVVVLGDRILGSVEIAAERAFYDYEAKYGNAGTEYFVPPRWSAEQIAAVERIGLAAHRALGCRSVTRTDVILGPSGPIALETNTLPGMTASSLVPKVAAAKGIQFDELIELILDRAAYGPSDMGECDGDESF